MKQFVIVTSTISFGKKIEIGRLVYAFDAESAATEEDRSMPGWKFERVEEYVEPKRRVRA